MSRKYKFHNPDGVYFVMFAVDYAGGIRMLDIFVIEWKSEVLKGTDYKSAPAGGMGVGLSNFPDPIAGGCAGKTYLIGPVSHIDLYNNPNDIFSDYWKFRTMFNK